MKVKLPLLLLAIIPICSIAQMRDTTQPMLSKTEYLKKSRGNETTAWILLGTGVTGLLATAIIDLTESVVQTTVTVFTLGLAEPEPKNSYTAAYLVSTGVGLASIPFFSAAAKNKRLAKSATTFIKYERAHIANGPGIVPLYYPAVALKIRL